MKQTSQSKDKKGWLIGLNEKTIYLLLETNFKAKDTHRIKLRRWKKYFKQMN